MLLFGKEGIVQPALFTLTECVFLSLKLSSCVEENQTKTMTLSSMESSHSS